MTGDCVFCDMFSVWCFISVKSAIMLQIPHTARTYWPGWLISMTKKSVYGKYFPNILKAKEERFRCSFYTSIYNAPLGLCALIQKRRAKLNLASFVELTINYGLRTDTYNSWENRGKILLLFVDCSTLDSILCWIISETLFNRRKNWYGIKYLLACASLSKGSK